MKTNLKRLCTRWKEEKRKWVKESTYATYVQNINCLLLPFFSESESIGEADVQRYVDEKISDGLSPKTVRDSLNVLKMVLKYGAKLGCWDYQEFTVHFPKGTRSSAGIKILDRRQRQILASYLAEHPSLKNLGLMICIQSGLRLGEVCALQWKDMDVKAGIIHIRKTISRVWLSDGDEKSCTLRIGTPKTDSSLRDIPMSSSLLKSVKPFKRNFKDDCFVISGTPQPLEPRGYREYFYRLLNKLGLPKVHFHALRHGFASGCIESKCDYKTVSAILGHASIATTLNMYVHPGYDDKKRCIEQMTKVLGVK